MLNKKRKGFTLMEIVLVMVLIAILATGVAIGFTSYINRGHESGITTDFNSTFKNPVRMEAIEKGKMLDIAKLQETAIADGFTDGTSADWQTAPVATNVELGVDKGNKRYVITEVTLAYDYNQDGDTGDAGETGIAGVLVRADHSSKDSATLLFLNEAKNDVIQLVGEATNATTFTTDEDVAVTVAVVTTP